MDMKDYNAGYNAGYSAAIENWVNKEKAEVHQIGYSDGEYETIEQIEEWMANTENYFKYHSKVLPPYKITSRKVLAALSKLAALIRLAKESEVTY